ncbi:alpha-ketoglutarate-dependent dioxygenase AlkB [Naumannella huperziae]
MSQVTLFDAVDHDEPGTGRYADGLSRRELTRGAWLDVRPGWVLRPDLLMERLLADTPWRGERRQMYDRVVDTPRLLSFHGAGDPWPHPLLLAMRAELSAHYRPELGEDFVTAGLCLYRDGRDSVAWHGDRIGRGSTHDTMVAIVSLGEVRRLALRPRGGGRSLQIPMASGDVVVMGGTAQRTWEHAVPKMRNAGPRISVQFRVAGVR